MHESLFFFFKYLRSKINFSNKKNVGRLVG